MESSKLAELLFPSLKYKANAYEDIFPPRDLDNGSKVTRIAPSPTGFIHLGNLYSAVVNQKLANQSNGIFYLRIDDTDSKREVPGSVDLIKSMLGYFGLEFHEGPLKHHEIGQYGPYYQSERTEIYHSFAKLLVEKGLAYPCFCTEKELQDIKNKQKDANDNMGYYGEWAVFRRAALEEIKERINNNEPYVLRFRSQGNTNRTILFEDAIKGKISLKENYQDIILLKSNGIPTYHFAHVIDDHLMRTTHVVRGEEWLPSLPIHIQLFESFNWIIPVYCHTAQLMKKDGNVKRKLSKREDPESALAFFVSEGYEPRVVIEYLLTILNSNFEEWKKNQVEYKLEDFAFSLEKMSKSGSLFDLQKLNDISKNHITNMSCEKIYDDIKMWAETYDKKFAGIFTNDRDYSINALEIITQQNRKDIWSWKQAKCTINFFFDELFKIENEIPEVNDEDKIVFLNSFLKDYQLINNKVTWLNSIQEIAVNMGFSKNIKDYKKDPSSYKGHIGQLNSILRVSIVGRIHTPDLWNILKVLGEEKVKARILNYLEYIKKN